MFAGLCAMTPPTLGLVLAGGLARRMGGGDKLDAARRRRHHPGTGAGTAAAAMHAAHPQCQRRSGPLRRRRDCRWCRTTCRVLPARSPESWPASIGPRRTRRRSNGCSAFPAIARSCRAIWPCGCTRRAPRQGTPLACARSGEWRHPVVGIWPVALRHDLRGALVDEDLRKIEVWTARHGIAVADWPTVPVDPFFNVNTPEDAAAAEASCGAGGRTVMPRQARAAPRHTRSRSARGHCAFLMIRRAGSG